MKIRYKKDARIILPNGAYYIVAEGQTETVNDERLAGWLIRNWPDVVEAVAEEPAKPRARRRPKRKPARAAFDEPPVEK